MQGYRTVVFNAVMTLAAGGTVQFTDLPPDAQHWLTMAVIAWGMISIFLRLVTKTPIGQKAVASVEAALGMTPEQMASIVQEVSRQAAAIAAQIPAVVQSAQGQAILAGIEPLPARAAQDIARMQAGLVDSTLVVTQQALASPPLVQPVTGILPQNAAVAPAQQQAATPAI